MSSLDGITRPANIVSYALKLLAAECFNRGASLVFGSGFRVWSLELIVGPLYDSAHKHKHPSDSILRLHAPTMRYTHRLNQARGKSFL